MSNYRQWVVGVLAVFLSQFSAFADPPKAVSKSASLSTPRVELANSTPAIDVRNLRWDPYQPFWRPQNGDYNVESFDFDDKSALERLTKLRSLSLVTFAETNHTRLFLGINDDGLVGLHFSAFPRHGKDRHLSLWSMPYVKDGNDVNDVDLDLSVKKPGVKEQNEKLVPPN